MHGGGTKLFCLGPDRTLASAVLPVLVKGSVSGGSKSYKYPPTPEGYEPAWDDGRLNPNRGKQTVEGVIDQDEIWTRTVPSELREDSKVQRKRLVIVERPTVAAAEPRREAVRASSKAAGGRYVQVGTFGVPANADGAAARLSSLGLPVARSRVQKGGRTLQIVLAGPFASQGEVQAALSAARRAGFGDAIVR
jgi:cell division protein FtsN